MKLFVSASLITGYPAESLAPNSFPALSVFTVILNAVFPAIELADTELNRSVPFTVSTYVPEAVWVGNRLGNNVPKQVVPVSLVPDWVMFSVESVALVITKLNLPDSLTPGFVKQAVVHVPTYLSMYEAVDVGGVGGVGGVAVVLPVLPLPPPPQAVVRATARVAATVMNNLLSCIAFTQMVVNLRKNAPTTRPIEVR